MLASHVPCLPTIQNFTCTLSTSYPNPHSEQQPESHPALSKATQQTATTTTSCSSAKCLSRDNCPAPTADATGFEPLHSCLTSTPRFPSSGRLGELIQHGEIQDLPSPLPLNGNLPTRAKLGSIVHDVEASAMNVHKIFHFAEKFAVCRGLELCTGNAYIPVFRQGLRITNRWMVRNEGDRLRLHVQVHPSAAAYFLACLDLKDSVRHHDGPRQRRLPGPRARVDSSRGLDQSESSGLWTISGNKCRRFKKRFSSTIPKNRVSASDLTSFITVDGERLTRIGMSVYASNDDEPDDEPEAERRTTISMANSKKMMTKIFNDEGEGDILAVPKRSIVFVFGKLALYLRMSAVREPGDEHHLVRLAGVHTAARVAELGADTWRRVAELAKDEEVLVRVGALRAVGRMAATGDGEALDMLEAVQK
ncbi:unnamed protein product, partial [Symbiodinium sp. KB8]